MDQYILDFMRSKIPPPTVSLFPFLSVLLSTMGILAFLAITFLLFPQMEQNTPVSKTIDFQWVGAPASVSPVFIRCYKDRVVYYDLFLNKEKTVLLKDLLLQIQGNKPDLLSYFLKILALNKEIQRNFRSTEYYPVLLVYPDGIISSELLFAIIEQIQGLNVGLEPMLPHWKVPYQSLLRKG